MTQTITMSTAGAPQPYTFDRPCRVPWDGPITLDAVIAAEGYLAARPLAEQVAVLTLIREVES